MYWEGKLTAFLQLTHSLLEIVYSNQKTAFSVTKQHININHKIERLANDEESVEKSTVS